ncbi:MAG TPA: AI-2E family transporter [Polyangiales bacterium]
MTPESRPVNGASQVTLKTVFTVCFGVLSVTVLVAAVWKALLVVLLIATAVLLAASLNHLVCVLAPRRMPRWAAIGLVLTAGVVMLGAFGWLLIPPAVDQVIQLIQRFPAFMHRLEQTAVFHRYGARLGLTEWLSGIKGRVPELVSGAASPLLVVLGGVVRFVGATLTVIFLTIFMLVFGRPVVQAALDEALPERRAKYEELLEKIYASLGGYVAGLAVICTMNATITTAFLALNDMPFFLPLGILSGFSSLVPYAGPLVVGASIALLSLISGGLGHGLATVFFFLVYGQLEGNLIAPLVFRRTVHVNPLMVLLSVVLFGEIAGVLGALAAVPAAATLQIVLRELLRVRRAQLAALRSLEVG